MATQNRFFTAAQGSLWVQPDGPNHEPLYLGCHDLADLIQPKGDVSQRYCPKPGGGWRVSKVTQAVPDRVTTGITTYVGSVADYLEVMKCPAALYVHQGQCGVRNAYLNYERGQVFQDGIITNITQSNLAMRETVDASEQTFEISGTIIEKYYQPIVELKTSGVAWVINDIIFTDENRCVGPCGPAQDGCDIGYAVTDNPTLLAGNWGEILWTHDHGTTWTSTTGHPFAEGTTGVPGTAPDQIISVTWFRVNDGVDGRVMVVRDNASAGGGALDIAYSDDENTWTNVVVGAATDIAVWNGALFALNENNVYLCWSNAALTVGYIAKSVDGGLTWVLQQTTGDSMNYIRFIDANYGIAVGDTEELWLTSDGGANWAAPVGTPGLGTDIQCCEILDSQRMWLGYQSGQLWYTENGGAGAANVGWFRRNFTFPADMTTTVNQINDIHFRDDYNGRFVFQYVGAGAAVCTAVYTTRDGGFNWEYNRPTQATTAWNALWNCGYNDAFMVGTVVAGAGMIHELVPSP